MKLNKIAVLLALTSVLSTAAAAQIIRIVPGLPSGVPVMRLPSPAQGVYSGTGVRLPSPAMTPSINLFPSAAALAPAAVAASAQPAFVGHVEETLPAVAIKASRENVAQIAPGVAVRFVERAGAPARTDADAERTKEKLDETFDGERKPGDVVGSGRHISLPEWDLERELGL